MTKSNFVPNAKNYKTSFKWTRIWLQTCLVTLSPISETNINVNAAVKPDFEIAAKTDEGPPFTNAISENTKAHPDRTSAIWRG